MAKVKKYQTSIRINGEVYESIKTYCKSNALCITRWIEIQLKKALGNVSGNKEQ